MALNFPDPATQTPVNTWSPTSTPSASTNGLTYLWDGAKWTTEGGVPNLHWTRAGSVLSPTNAGDDVQIASLNSGPLAGFRNQLINSDFRVAQRGIAVTETTGGYRTLDRWYVGRTASCEEEQVNSVALEQEAGTSKSMRLNPGSAGNIRQMIEIEEGRAGVFQQGTTWTLSFYCNRENTSVDIGFADGVSGSSNYVSILNTTTVDRIGTSNRYKTTFTVPGSPNGSNKGVRISIVPSTTEYTDFTGVQLEPGPVATMFEMRPIGTELALCQRYYWNTSPVSGGVTRIGCGLINSSLNSADIMVPLPAPMRTTPTLIQGNTAVYDGGSTITVTNSNISGLTASTLRLDSTLASNSVLGRGALLQGADMAFDAEL